MINLKNLKQITEDEPELLNQFLNQFLTTTHIDLEDIESAITKNKADEVTRLAHRVKGSSMIIGAEKLTELCRKLEDAGAQNHSSRFPLLLAKMKISYADLSQYIKSL